MSRLFAFFVYFYIINRIKEGDFVINMSKITSICGKMPSKKQLQIVMDIASGLTATEIIKKYNITLEKYKEIKTSPINRFIIIERKKAIKQTVYRVFGKVDGKYEIMVNKYMERLLEDERIDKTSLMALVSIVNTFASIYKKVSEIDTLSKKQILDLKRYKLEKQHYEILRKMRIADNIPDSEGTPNSIIADFYSKLNEMATDDFKQKDIEITEEMKEQMLDINLEGKNENQLRQMQAMVNKQLKLMEKNKIDKKEESEQKRQRADETKAFYAEQRRRALKRNVKEINIEKLTNNEEQKHSKVNDKENEYMEDIKQEKIKKEIINNSDEEIK